MTMGDAEFEFDSDQDISENHSKLIEAVTQLDKRQRITRPDRTEPTLEISEFHLTKGGLTDEDAVSVQDLAKSLGSKGYLTEVSKRLEVARKKAKVLPKPLERPAADRIKRLVGFDNTKKELRRWNAVIAKNRVADHMSFPLKSCSLKPQPTVQFLKRFRIQSELEKELAKLEPPKDKPLSEENKYSMTLEEAIERRKEAAKLRAQQSYKEAKAHRQKRIKSKKFHRVQRKERIKQELKEFEGLQKTDPQAALEKLERLDKTRAEERMSLRHRSTGQWAKNKQVRAKYDNETRQELAQQLSIGRTLTEKVQKAEDSTDDDTENDVLASATGNDKENPWLNGLKTESEIDDFVGRYRKYWDEKNKSKKGDHRVLDANKEDSVNWKAERSASNPVVSVDTVYINKTQWKEKPQREIEKDGEESTERRNSTVVKAKKTGRIRLEDTSGEEYEKSHGKIVFREDSEKVIENDKDVVTANSTSVWQVEPVKDHNRNRRSHISVAEKMDEIFDDMDEKIQRHVAVKLESVKEKLRSDVQSKRSDKRTLKSATEEDVFEGLAFNNQKLKLSIDEPLNESVSEKDPRGESERLTTAENSTTATSRKGKEKSEIDPRKYINVKPKHLKTQLPNVITGGDEALDDSENEEENRMIISEAFADDDVVEEFRKEKEDEIKKSQPEDVDLSMPGWGSWGGKNVKVSRRKRARFVLKFPKDAPRRDENKGDVIITEDNDAEIRAHQVNELPYPFASVKDFEASMRAPIGRNFVPENAHRRLVKPAVRTVMGKIIEPMDEDVLVNTSKMKKNLPERTRKPIKRGKKV